MIGRARLVEAPGLLSPMVEREIPSVGPGEVLLKLHATSVNYHDIVGIDGHIKNVLLPRVPFSDGVGTVLSIGQGVVEFAVGDRLIPAFFPHWSAGRPTYRNIATLLGDQIDGCLQTHLVVPASSCVRAPSHMTHEEAATLGCAGLTAWRSLVVEADLKPGQTVVLQGTGGVSLFALGFAKMLGARVILLTSSTEKMEKARTLGADVVINYRTQPDWNKEVLAQTNGKGADLVVEVGGGETLTRSVRALRVGGHLSVIGVLSGYAAPSFPLAEVMRKNLRVVGITVGSISDLDDMCHAMAQSQYRPVIDSVFDLANAEEAIALMRRQGHFGKIVIRTE